MPPASPQGHVSLNECIRYFIVVYFGLTVCAAITMVVVGLMAYDAGVSAMAYTISTVSTYFVIAIPMGAILPFFIGFFSPIPLKKDHFLVSILSGVFAVIGSILISLTVLLIAVSVLGGGSLAEYAIDVFLQYIIGVFLIPLLSGILGSALSMWRPHVA